RDRQHRGGRRARRRARRVRPRRAARPPLRRRGRRRGQPHRRRRHRAPVHPPRRADDGRRRRRRRRRLRRRLHARRRSGARGAMKLWEQALVGPETTLRDALETIDRAGSQMVLVVDRDRVLLGTLSDGDARRGLLRGLGLADPVALAMHRQPTVATAGESRQSMLATMRRLGLHQLPIVDAQRRVVGLEIVDDYFAAQPREHWVVIMAGGRGMRLEELTRDTPKPMLRVGSRPLLETIVREYVRQGFSNFWLAVNYKAEQIESHFGDGG